MTLIPTPRPGPRPPQGSPRCPVLPAYVGTEIQSQLYADYTCGALGSPFRSSGPHVGCQRSVLRERRGVDRSVGARTGEVVGFQFTRFKPTPSSRPRSPGCHPGGPDAAGLEHGEGL